jgi:4-hydroxyphenylacetate 3-monooxygenase
MHCKTGEEHLKSLRDGRTVYLDGRLVDDVTTHPAYRNAVASGAALYDYQARPENIGLMTFLPEGGTRRVSRSWQMPRSYDELVQRRKALQAWAQVTYGFMGRSLIMLPLRSSVNVWGLEVFEKHGPARAKALADYVDYARKSDLFLTYVIVNPQADRSKDWGEQQKSWLRGSLMRTVQA